MPASTGRSTATREHRFPSGCSRCFYLWKTLGVRQPFVRCLADEVRERDDSDQTIRTVDDGETPTDAFVSGSAADSMLRWIPLYRMPVFPWSAAPDEQHAAAELRPRPAAETGDWSASFST